MFFSVWIALGLTGSPDHGGTATGEDDGVDSPGPSPFWSLPGVRQASDFVGDLGEFVDADYRYNVKHRGMKENIQIIKECLKEEGACRTATSAGTTLLTAIAGYSTMPIGRRTR